MSVKLVDPRNSEKEAKVGDTVINSMLGTCKIKEVEFPYEDITNDYSFPGRVLIENSNGVSDWFYAMETGLIFIEVT